jgi:hypothetical protein
VAASKKNMLFALKNGNSNFYEAKLKPYLEEMFVMRRCTHLPNLDALSLFVLVFCDLHAHLGGKA